MYITILNETYRKARKQHDCSACGKPITVGTVHCAQVNVCDGRVYTWREHAVCRALAPKDESREYGWLSEADLLTLDRQAQALTPELRAEFDALFWADPEVLEDLEDGET